MVSFRFYLVSVTAIFLALAVGITVGATVIDKATVDLLQSQIRAAKSRAAVAERNNNAKDDLLARADEFEKNAAGAFVQGRLTETPVLVLAVHGNKDDEDAINNLRDLFTTAGARVQGVLWFNSKMKLDKPEDSAALANALGLPPGVPPDVARRTAISRLAATWSGVQGVPTALTPLLTLQMAEFRAGTVKDPNNLSTERSRFVVAAPTEPAVPDDQLGLPLVSELARTMSNRVVAVEAGRDASDDGKQPAARELLVGPMRVDPTLRARVSTVDDIDELRGRIVAIYAVQNLAAGVIAHYGVGPNAHNNFNLSPQP